MRRLCTMGCGVILALVLAVAVARSAEPGVRELRFEPVDAQRSGRAVPVKVYMPDAITSPTPVVLFSHGLGGSREGGAYLGRHWAAAGYVVVCMQHPGSDESVWRNVARAQRMDALKKAAGGRSFMDRVSDVAFVLDTLEAWYGDPKHPLGGKMDLRHIGMSGHSFGAVTTQAIMGQRYGRGRSLGDPRLSAFVALSPSPARDGRDPRESFGQVQKPVMCMTGTKDRSVINRDVTPEMRRTVYRALAPGDKYELVLDKAEHGAFGNRRLPGERGNPRYHAAILRITTAFWDAYLRGDAQAKAWLQSDTAREVLVKEDVWEWK